jgi:hypothetical protein
MKQYLVQLSTPIATPDQCGKWSDIEVRLAKQHTDLFVMRGMACYLLLPIRMPVLWVIAIVVATTGDAVPNAVCTIAE